MRRVVTPTRRFAGRISANFGILLSGAILMAFVLKAVPYYLDALDREDWVSAVLTVKVQPEGPPVVDYHYTATRSIEAVWRAYLEGQGGFRLSRSFYGVGRYRPDRDAPEPWTWPAFFGDEVGPRVPTVPYRVCVRYHMESRSGVERDTGPFCSEWVFPQSSEQEG